MSSRYWIAAIAFGLIAGLGNAQDQPAAEDQPGQEESISNGQDQGADEQAAAIDPTPALEGIESAIRDLKAEIDQVEQERQRENDRRDLGAQEAMAKWAFWMFVATTATVILTAIALWGILRTLHHTKRAANFTGEMVEEAKATTSAANETVVEARESNRILREEQRPWLDFEIEDAVVVKTDAASTNLTDTRAEMGAVVTNFGKSPAIQPFFVKGIIVSNREERLQLALAPTPSVYETLVDPYVTNGYDKLGANVFVGKPSRDLAFWNEKTDLTEVVDDPEIEIWIVVVALVYKDAEGLIYWTGKTYYATPPENVSHSPGVKIVTGGGDTAGAVGAAKNVMHT